MRHPLPRKIRGRKAVAFKVFGTRVELIQGSWIMRFRGIRRELFEFQGLHRLGAESAGKRSFSQSSSPARLCWLGVTLATQPGPRDPRRSRSRAPPLKACSSPRGFCFGGRFLRDHLRQTQPSTAAQLKKPQCGPILPSESSCTPRPPPITPAAVRPALHGAWARERSWHRGNPVLCQDTEVTTMTKELRKRGGTLADARRA